MNLKEIGWKPSVVAFGVSPLVVPLVMFTFGLMNGEVTRLSLLPNYIFIYSVFGAYPATLVFGIPAFFIFRKYGWSKSVHFAIAGALVGLLTSFFVIEGHSFLLLKLSLLPRLLCTVAGALSAMAFRAILFFRHRTSLQN